MEHDKPLKTDQQKTQQKFPEKSESGKLSVLV